MKTAEKADWQTSPLSSKRAAVKLNKIFSAEESKAIQKGLIPKEMEDKWFIYWENNTLFFHRSWTGTCIYIVHFLPEGNNFRMVSADVNRNPEQYIETDDNRDIKMISYLIDILLLHKKAVFPDDDSTADNNPLKEWSQVGRAMTGEYTDD